MIDFPDQVQHLGLEQDIDADLRVLTALAAAAETLFIDIHLRWWVHI
jgi:predicted unusual protein kinase regulating ubiquinone biosynthesis (AarF/ABC1/UbiB family)